MLIRHGWSCNHFFSFSFCVKGPTALVYHLLGDFGHSGFVLHVLNIARFAGFRKPGKPPFSVRLTALPGLGRDIRNGPADPGWQPKPTALQGVETWFFGFGAPKVESPRRHGQKDRINSKYCSLGINPTHNHSLTRFNDLDNNSTKESISRYTLPTSCQ